LDFNSNFHGIIFCNTKRNVDTLVHQLTKLNYRAAALHGDVTQDQREKILKQFRTGHVKVLVATDVAARGIDVEDLTHIINYSLPLSSESYVHRIGRTGRAGKKGVAISFVIPSEKRKLNSIERNNNCKLIQKEFPLPKDIIEKKEEQVKEIIKNIIEANMGKSSKYKAMADGLLKKYHAGEVVSAILKYSFKNELDVNSYNDLGQLRMSSSREGRKKRQRGRRRPRSRDRRSNNEFDNKKTEHKTFSDHQANNKDKKPRNSSFKKKRRRR
jgi:ATP-dependent RNA helicase DeaD